MSDPLTEKSDVTTPRLDDTTAIISLGESNMDATTAGDAEEQSEETSGEVKNIVDVAQKEEWTNVDSDNNQQPQQSHGWDYQLSSHEAPLSCIAMSPDHEFREKCLKGCKWAPDGSCLLVNSDDKCLRLFNIPAELLSVTDWSEPCLPGSEWSSVLKVKEGGQVYDYCCFITTAQDNPVHLWDAFSGELRATYVACNYADMVIAAHSITFDTSAQKIYCGYQNCVRIFDIDRPGRQCVIRQHKDSILPDLNLPGIVSCIATSPSQSVYACGSFDKRIGIYMEDGTPLTTLQAHRGGLTQLKFSLDGMKLFSGARRDSYLICWDMRNLGREYQIYDRVVTTSQRVYFDVTPNEKYLVTGCTNGEVRVWDLKTQTVDSSDQLMASNYAFSASTDCVNGISLNPYLPLMAVATGQRHLPALAKDDEDELFVDPESKLKADIGIRLFKFA